MAKNYVQDLCEKRCSRNRTYKKEPFNQLKTDLMGKGLDKIVGLFWIPLFETIRAYFARCSKIWVKDSYPSLNPIVAQRLFDFLCIFVCYYLFNHLCINQYNRNNEKHK